MEAKRSYYLQIFSGVSDSTQTWRELRNLGLIRPRVNSLPLCISAEQLNEYFISASHNPNECLVTTSTSVDDILVPFNDEGFYFQYITPEVLSKYMARSLSHSSGVDGITNFFIRKFPENLSIVLLEIFNFSLSNSVFPNLWKNALVRPINKVRKPSSPADFRPISILCALSKTLEKIVHYQVTDYLSAKAALDPFNLAFAKVSVHSPLYLKLPMISVVQWILGW
jgi:hypothetical protein